VWILPKPEVLLGEDVVVSDIGGWRREDVPILPDAWLVTPADRTLEVLRLRDGAWTIVGVWEDAAVVRAEPFDAIELELGRLWADPPVQP